MPPIKNLFGFRKNKGLDKSIIQKNPYRNNTDLNKRQFIKKGLFGLAGLGGLALASKIAKAGGLVFNDSSYQPKAGNKRYYLVPNAVDQAGSAVPLNGTVRRPYAVLNDAEAGFAWVGWQIPSDFTSISTIKMVWSTTSGVSSKTARFEFRSISVAEDESSEGGSQDTIAEASYVSSATGRGETKTDISAVVDGLTLTEADEVGFAVKRDGADAADDVGQAVKIYGFEIVLT